MEFQEKLLLRFTEIYYDTSGLIFWKNSKHQKHISKLVDLYRLEFENITQAFPFLYDQTLHCTADFCSTVHCATKIDLKLIPDNEWRTWKSNIK